MKNLLLTVFLTVCFASCKKENTASSNTETGNLQVAAVIADPVNFPPSVSNVKPNALQLNYGSIKIAKSANLLLSGVTPEIMAVYSFHIYVKNGSKYLHLPALSPLANNYTYSLKATYPYCSVTITRPAGTAELFNDVIVVAVKNAYAATFTPAINFEDYNVAKVKLGL